ncbi:MAG TPA: rod-binding protein [Phycisphaerae bacterium]|nr:rod-binding protein [Phycisphaerae bacterium]HOJ72744.1 rod-binding protein [Phycisphaerae bacterium]HOM51829.1 rod-binding protein [Phycisphaerae bacterium]HON67243.1 rod-binding protein [Phycisphaerae bacterium]HOQ84407.1 rod-binding protein [Phycisphaerae bacterium]
MEAVALTSSSSTPADRRQVNAEVRRLVDEFVGVTFFAPMLKTAHNSVLKGKYGHGGRGEEIFQSQLDLEFARNMGRGVRNSLADELYRRLTRQV